MKNENFITIQGWMINELKLSGNDLIVYAVIFGFSQDGKSKFKGTRNNLAEWCGCKKRAVSDILNRLVERQLIIKNNNCEYWADLTRCKICTAPDAKNAPPRCKNCTPPSAKNAHNYIYNNIDIIKDNTNNVRSTDLQEKLKEMFNK